MMCSGSGGPYDAHKWNLSQCKKGMIRNSKPENAHCDSYRPSSPHLFIQHIFLLSIGHVLQSGDMETTRANTAPVLVESRAVGKTNKEIITHLIDSLQL